MDNISAPTFPPMVAFVFVNCIVFYPLNSIVLCADNDTGIICRIRSMANGMNDCTCLRSQRNERIDIRDLNCRTYDEFIVALELHDLIYGTTLFNNTDKNLAAKCKEQAQKILELEEKVKMFTTKFEKFEKLMNE